MKRILALAFTLLSVQLLVAQQKRLFNSNWEFVKNADTAWSASLSQKSGSIAWEKINLPHTANLEPIVKTAQQWQGISFYRKFFTIPVAEKGKHVALRFDAAMQEADVYLNGVHIFNHKGGYLPFYIDISSKARYGAENSIVIRLDNRDNKLIPPGKPLRSLDFNYYSGIYRDTWLIVKDPLHITDAVAANRKAGGGVFIHYEKINSASATLMVQTDVANDGPGRAASVKTVLTDRNGKLIASATTPLARLAAGETRQFAQSITIRSPKLWSPDAPYLYNLSVEVLSAGKVVDSERVKTGIRTLRFDGGTFYLNGKELKIRGTNRHQEYPLLGNAASDNAQYRDAWKIKQAGFNFVRSSHYPQSNAYLDACDELGILVMDAIPGWQFVGNEQFQQLSFQDSRDMIRRDRNHPSIMLWEASLNESGMKKEFMEAQHKIVHEELPFENIYSAGWIDNVYDVFLPARQHGKAPDYWRKYAKNKPLLIAEYGDWEYYAQNAGFNQTAFKDLKAEERTSRQLRGWGEKRLLQQALNYQEAHNDNLNATVAFGDANWLMFDYNRGYAQDIESSGIMDMTRLPKFAFYFYQSQVDPVITGGTPFNKPMVFIANYWMPGSDNTVKVYSNCEEVELFLDGKSLGRKKPDRDAFSTNLKHPPFTFVMNAFAPGKLTATAYLNGRAVVSHVRETAGTPAKILLSSDISGKALESGRNDVVFVYATLTDAKGAANYTAANKVDFTVSGDAQIVGPASISAEAGIATILIKAGSKPGQIVITAKANGLANGQLVVNSK